MSKAVAALLIVASLFQSGLALGAPLEVSPSVALPSNYELKWQDEFSDAQLDLSKWRAGTAWRDSARQTIDAVRVDQGILKLTTYTKDGEHSTGFLSSQGLFESSFGFYEAKIRFRDSPGSWCAFWIQSPTVGRPVGDPSNAGVEIDIAEHRATDENGKDLRNTVVMNLHWDGYGTDHKRIGSEARGSSMLQNDWHTYAVSWTPKSYAFYLDGKKTWETFAPISLRTQFLRLTCEVRAQSWAGPIPRLGYGDLDHSTTGMDVDWVRVWQER